MTAGVRGFDGEAEPTPPCVQSKEVSFSLNTSGPVHIEGCIGKKLSLTLKDFPADSVCHLSRPVDSNNGSHSFVLPPLSTSDSGEFTLNCDASRGAASISFVLHVLRRPSKPKLRMINRGVALSPYFQCVSEGYPKPTLKWKDIENAKSNIAYKSDQENPEQAQRIISSSLLINQSVVCCASNSVGEVCSQVYDYDLSVERTQKHEAPEVTVSVGQSLLLRCSARSRPLPEWRKDPQVAHGSIQYCATPEERRKKTSGGVIEEICFLKDSYNGVKMADIYIESATVNHSGLYICSGTREKSVLVHVLDDFLAVQMVQNKTILAQETNTVCLQARVSSQPALQRCSWEDPDGRGTNCLKTKNGTLELCGLTKSGEYKLHLEAGRQITTRTVSLCVADTARYIDCHYHQDVEVYKCEANISAVPTNATWKCSGGSKDGTCIQQDSFAVEVKGGSDLSCSVTISSSLNTSLIPDAAVQFCLTNSAGTRCSPVIYVPPEVGPFKDGLGDDGSSYTSLKTCSVGLLLALIVVSVLLVHSIKKKKPQYQSQLQMIQMVGPHDNDYIYINFKHFEYDRKWEFPRENLELGKELGSGAFGMVVQATAYGINEPGVSQQVAVKMLKEKHQTVEREALMSELKMLTHIGNHDNVVNLLGACTSTGPTLLIFQYCCYGDLLNYMKNSRERYHKSLTDAFARDRFSSLYHNLLSERSSSEFQRVDNYVPMHPSTRGGQENIALLSLHLNPLDCTEDPGSCEESEEPPEEMQALTYNDLLSFAYQVAKGMEFLSSKNCIHRDLAARNVLITKGRLVKIGDFGLARDIDNDSNYVVKGNVRLPVKWMAPESIFQGMYTMNSDVWGYGILLWEIFSLGVTPYPGVKVDNKFYTMIETGFKMECPYYASDYVYGIMCKCWDLEPINRPPFSKLVVLMDDQLADMEEKLYHNMLDQDPNDSNGYQNPAAVLDISTLAREKSKEPSHNEYCHTPASEGTTPNMSDMDVMSCRGGKNINMGSE